MLKNIVKLLPIFTNRLHQSMSIVKATKTTKTVGQSQSKVTEIFRIVYKNESTQQQKQKMYLNFLASSKGSQQLQQQNYIRFLEYNKKHKIIQYTKQCIARNYTEVTPEMQRVVNNFFGFCFRLFFQIVSHNKNFNKSHPLWKEIAQTIISASQFYYLMPKSKKNCLLFFRTIPHQKKVVPHQLLHLNLRLTIDTLLQMPIQYFTETDLFSLMKRLYQANIHFYYYRRSTQVILHFWKPLKNIWYLYQEARRTITTAMSIISFYDQFTLNIMEKMLMEDYQATRKYTPIEVVNFLNILIKFGRINSDNYREYEKMIEKTVKYIEGGEQQGYYFQISVQNFYMAGVWSLSYWQAFMNFLKKDKSQQIQFYKLYVLSFLLQKFPQQIPPQIHQISQPLKTKIAQNPNFQGKQMILDFHDKQTQPRGLSCQVQLANSLRLFNNYKIVTQELVQIFFVDILLDNKYVIEVNGATHFNYDLDQVERRSKEFDFRNGVNEKGKGVGDVNGVDFVKFQCKKKQYNLKSKFKTKVLSKLGYYVIDLDLESYSQGSFQILSILCDIIWSGKAKEEVVGITFTPPTNKNKQDIKDKKDE